MYKSPAIAQLLRWASENKTGTDEMRSVADSLAWEHIDSKIDRDFGREGRHLRMGFSLDGVNLFSMQRTIHSTWPVMVVLYNLPPYQKVLCFSLYLLISGKESPTLDNVDIYLQPLVEELATLWDGVEAIDAALNIPVEERCFTMRGILMWTILDFPAYRLISGLCTKGYLVCPICGPNTVSRSAKGPKK
jgi:hypothetical protein